jgi:ABC-2 type transport system ATP-binding protein
VLTKLDNDVLKLLGKYGEVSVVSGNRVLVRNPSVDSSVLISELVSNGIGVLEARREEKSLEDYFFNLVKRAESGEL